MSILLCDTNGEIWYTRAKDLQMNVIKMPYTLCDQEYYYDLGERIDIKEFYAKVRSGSTAVTSALNPEIYREIIEPIYMEGQDVLYVSFSHAMSGTFDHLNTAINMLKEQYPERKCTVFDTNSISLGAGIQMEQACIMKQQGASDQEIIDFLHEFTHKVGVYFMVDDLMHLKRGGRLTGMQATVGSLLQLKPILTVSEKGGLQVVKKISGKKKALMDIANKVSESLVDEDKYSLYIVDADNTEDGDYLATLIQAKRPNAKIVRQIVGPVIGAHCGPGTIGVIYIANSRPIPLKGE